MTRSLNRILIVAACAVTISLFTAGAVTVPTCATGVSLAFYETTYNPGGTSGVGCQIGDKIFDNFSYGASGSSPVPVSQVTVTPLDPSPFFGAGEIGLQFEGLWQATGAGTSSDATIGFTVTVVNGANMEITDAGLLQSLAGSTEPGTGSVTELGCSGLVAPCTQVWGIATSQGSPISTTILAPTGSITVGKDIGVTGAAGGSATNPTQISFVQDVFSQTAIPEPRSTAAVLSLLIIGLVFRKKFQSVRG